MKFGGAKLRDTITGVRDLKKLADPIGQVQVSFSLVRLLARDRSLVIALSRSRALSVSLSRSLSLSFSLSLSSLSLCLSPLSLSLSSLSLSLTHTLSLSRSLSRVCVRVHLYNAVAQGAVTRADDEACNGPPRCARYHF